ncbi:hypothetical protein R3P38DRAFT_2853472 [Favolaschia claudopus]|uniref:Uncharacterized protein n=1 Tax=Favolaschia claudopus TaxID=2862362 RepID=A0AAW0DMJ3_9AGAR
MTMHDDFDPFNPDPNSESYVPEPESPRRFKLRFWINAHNLRPKHSRRKSSRVRGPAGDTGRRRQPSLTIQTPWELGQTAGSSPDPVLEDLLALDAWADRLSRISEDDELYPYPRPPFALSTRTMSDPGHDLRTGSQDSLGNIPSSPTRRWLNKLGLRSPSEL